MSVGLLAPLGLAALAALALPILIHLVRRIELQRTEFAALRWISERVRPRRRIRFERPWLLLVRLLLLGLLAVLLARPILLRETDAAATWVAILPGVDLTTARAAVDARGVDGRWHWLAPGFPAVDAATAPPAVPPSSLMRELDATLPAATRLVVVVPSELGGLDGERPRLGRAIDWVIVPGASPTDTPDVAASPSTLAVRFDAANASGVRYLRAAVAAWNAREPGRYRLDAQALSAPIGTDATWLVWLAPDLSADASEWIERGGRAVVTGAANAQGDPFWRDASARPVLLAAPMGRGLRLDVPGPFEPATLPALLDADFPDRLLLALRGEPAAPSRADALAISPLHTAPPSAASARDASAARPLDAWLAILIALLVLIERVIATRAPSAGAT